MSYKYLSIQMVISYLFFILGLFINNKVDGKLILGIGLSLFASQILSYLIVNKGFGDIQKDKLLAYFYPLFLLLFAVFGWVCYQIL